MLTLNKISKLSAVFFMICAFMFSANTFAQRVIEIHGTDNMKFDVTKIDAKPGEKITVKLSMNSKLPAVAMSHNWVLLDQGTDARAFSMSSARFKDNEYIDPSMESKVLAHTKMASGNQVVEVTFTAPKAAGDYEYVCTFPGHYVTGMKGILTVK